MKLITADGAPAAIGPYSHAVEHAGLVLVSGQLGLDPATGKLAGPEFDTQTRQALANLLAVLKGAGCTPHDLLSVDVFLTDLADFATFNTLYEAALAGHKPARACVQVAALPAGGLVELKAVARKP